MWPVSSNFRQALRGSHEVVVRGTVYFGGAVTMKRVRFDSGSVSVDGDSLVRRTISNVGIVAEDGNTETLRDVLSVFGAELQIERGIRFPTGRVEVAPIGRFRIDAVEEDLAVPGRLTISGNDLSVRILDDAFPAPRGGATGLTIFEQIERFTQQAVPGAIVHGSLGVFEDLGRGIVFESSRIEAIAALAKSVGGVFYCRPDGDFALDPIKGWTSAPQWTIRSGERGVLLGGKREESRDTVRNYVRVTGNATNGNAVPTGIAQDSDVASPTYVGGPFGRVPLVLESSHIRTTSQAQAAAEAILSKSLGARSSLSISTIVNPALEAGDRIDVVMPNGIGERHIVDAFDIPLTADGAMTITTRTKGAA